MEADISYHYIVSEDAMIVPAICINSVWRFAQNSWDIMSPWNKHHHFRFYKLGVGKVLNRLILSCTPLKWLRAEFSGILFQSRISFWEDSWSSHKVFCNKQENWFGRGWEEWGLSTGDTKTPVTPPRGFKTVHKCPILRTIPDFRFLETA